MRELFSLAGQVALVTGASGGLGAHFAQVLATAGATVAVAARRDDRVAAVVSEIVSTGSRALAVSLDVTNPESVAGAFDVTEQDAGLVTVVVNNAGIIDGERALDVSESEWDRVIDTNLKGAWVVAQEAARRMIAANIGGSIVNIASILGFRVSGRIAPYAISKAGVVQMTKALALEWSRYNNRVNALAPGYVETDINREFLKSDAGAKLIRRIPQRRIGRPEDLDGSLLLLASDASGYMTGSIIPVDGGHLVSSL